MLLFTSCSLDTTALMRIRDCSIVRLVRIEGLRIVRIKDCKEDEDCRVVRLVRIKDCKD